MAVKLARMFSLLSDSFEVPSSTDIPEAVTLTIRHFACGSDQRTRIIDDHAGLILPSYMLRFRGFEIPVSTEDTAGTLESRILAYLIGV